MLNTIPSIVSDIRKDILAINSAEAFRECAENTGIIIDVREPNEVKQSPISGSINIPRGVLEMKMLELYPNADLPIYIHCASGVRAIFSAEQLQRVGYGNVKAITCKLSDIQETQKVK